MSEKKNYEEWKPVIGYEGRYEVSNKGNVKSLYGRKNFFRELMLKPGKTSKKYLSVSLSLNEITKTHLVHRLVAQAFIKKSNNLKEVNHKDGNKLNNNVENLEWCTASYNMKHSLDTGLHKHYTRPVLQIGIEGNIIKEWSTIGEVRKVLGYTEDLIRKVCQGKRLSYKNCIWKFI